MKIIKNVKNKIVLIRAGLDVSYDKKTGKILSDFRLQKQLPLIKQLYKAGAKIVIMGHRGRPKGNGFEPELTLAPVAQRLAKLLKLEVALAPDCIGNEVKSLIDNSGKDIVVLENLRFHKEEKANSSKFAKQLASLADVYINNAFSVSHRKHASMYAITKYIPAYAGNILIEETKSLSKIANRPKPPFILVVGGLKIKSKIDPILKLGEKADYIIIGGALATTFLYAQGYEVGQSIYLPEEVNVAKKIIDKFEANVVLPLDVRVSQTKDLKRVNKLKIVPSHSVNSRERIYDIGPRSLALFSDFFEVANTVFWAGPMGLFEFPKLCPGTINMMRAAVKKVDYTVFAGGETVSALEMAGLLHKASHASVGGSAALDFVAGKTLPALEVLGYYR